MDDIAQRMLARRKGSLNSSVVVGLLLAVGISALPMCDACHEAAEADAFAGLGMSSSGPSALWPCVMWLAIGVATAVVVIKLGRRAEGLVLVVLGTAVAAWMICSSSAKIARTRSDAVDTWPSCFHSTDEFGAELAGPTMGGTSHDPFDGPHQAFTGEPCVEKSEHREDHRREQRGGDVADGIHQIMYRFPEDRGRVIYLPVLLLGCLLLALVVAIVGVVRRAPPDTPP